VLANPPDVEAYTQALNEQTFSKGFPFRLMQIQWKDDITIMQVL